MTITQAIVLGLVQGITEFLPISSSGFLILVPEVLGWDLQSQAFDAFLHVATLLAIVAALWSEVVAIGKALLIPSEDSESRMWRAVATWVLLATLPVLGVGYLVSEFLGIEFRSVEVVAWSFIVWGTVLYVVDRSVKQSKDDIRNIGFNKALLIGLSQAIAIIPGTSRSGITMTAGLAAGLSRVTAAKFSFLLSIPTIAAAGFFKLGQVASGKETVELFPLAVGFFVAMISAFLTAKFLLAFVKNHTFSEFAIFRILVGVAILLLL